MSSLRSYADYDTILAARLVHFFLSEAARLGHPPRILDMGCGRGSYVEVFKSWGLPVMGIDGTSTFLSVEGLWQFFGPCNCIRETYALLGGIDLGLILI